jgi:hypothetical protein
MEEKQENTMRVPMEEISNLMKTGDLRQGHNVIYARTVTIVIRAESFPCNQFLLMTEATEQQDAEQHAENSAYAGLKLACRCFFQKDPVHSVLFGSLRRIIETTTDKKVHAA